MFISTCTRSQSNVAKLKDTKWEWSDPDDGKVVITKQKRHLRVWWTLSMTIPPLYFRLWCHSGSKLQKHSVPANMAFFSVASGGGFEGHYVLIWAPCQRLGGSTYSHPGVPSRGVNISLMAVFWRTVSAFWLDFTTLFKGFHEACWRGTCTVSASEIPYAAAARVSWRHVCSEMEAA